jgi:hypothetical protein
MVSPWIEVAIVAALIAALPFAIVYSKKHARGRLGGAAMMIGLAFGHLFDPAAARSTEAIRRNSDTGESEAAGAPPENRKRGQDEV